MIDWGYLAGFIDGEGSIGMRNFISPKIQITQSGKEGLAVLGKIKSFLLENGFRTSNIYKHKSNGIIKSNKQCFRMETRGYANEICNLLNILTPYLEVKRVVAQDIVRFFKLYPPLQGNGILISEGKLKGHTHRHRIGSKRFLSCKECNPNTRRN